MFLHYKKAFRVYADNSYTGTEFTLWSLTSNVILRKNTGLQLSVIFDSMFGTTILYGICLKRLTMHIRHFSSLLVVSMDQPSMKLPGPFKIRLYVQIMILFLEEFVLCIICACSCWQGMLNNSIYIVNFSTQLFFVLFCFLLFINYLTARACMAGFQKS